MGIDENIEIDQEKRCGAMLLVHHGKNGGSVREGDEYEDEDYYYGKGNRKRFFSLGYSNSTPWIVLQVTWRLIVSMIVALAVFYIATKPPAPKGIEKTAFKHPRSKTQNAREALLNGNPFCKENDLNTWAPHVGNIVSSHMPNLQNE
ncbi:hypothetical protein RND71_007550 [Anisodus tanguticus]|uniref:Uncharacterized protein n=1 Tax=Anisodus tanguticus TaxID=243964 RepID=A0AAE1SM61_9SOLA|nr:hypothetical protein RND71_007550 [Anisodus tanguticus]